VLRFPPEEPLSQLPAERQITTQCNSEVRRTSMISRHMLGSLRHSEHTYTYSKRKSCCEWHESNDWPVSLGKLPSKCSENLLLGSCICSNRGLCPSVVPQRSHKADRSTFKQVNTYYHWLPAKHTHLILAHSIWHYPIWDKAQCKALNLKHLLRETQCLCSRKHLCSQNCCQLTGNQPHQSLHPSFPHLVHYLN